MNHMGTGCDDMYWILLARCYDVSVLFLCNVVSGPVFISKEILD